MLLVERLEAVVLRGVAALASDVHDEQNLCGGERRATTTSKKTGRK